MNNFWKDYEKKLINFFAFISKISLLIVGLLIVSYIFKELFYLANYMIIPETGKSYYLVFEKILSFFILLEFLLLVRTALKYGGNVSLTFLITLAITAIVRSLLIKHDDDWFIIIISVSVLILSISLAIIHKYELDDIR